MTIEWQRTMTPRVVLLSVDARGCVHRSITDPLGGTEKYYYQKARSGKVFLHKNHNVEPPDVGGHHEVRVKMAAAVAAWQNLSESEKESWSKHSYALAFNLPGYQTFIHHFMKDLV